MKMILKTAAVTLAAGVMSASMGSALTLKTGSTTCSIGDVTGASACAGAFDGNNSNQNLNGLFGVSDWGDELKVDASSGKTFPLTVTEDGDEKTGTWKIDAASVTDPLMIVLKGSNSFTAYLIPAGSDTSGTWTTASLVKGNPKPGDTPKFGPGLSHFSVYGDIGPAVVPLPASAVLLLAGLGGLGMMRRKR